MPWPPGCQREVMCGEDVGVVSVFGTGPLKAGEFFEL